MLIKPLKSLPTVASPWKCPLLEGRDGLMNKLVARLIGDVEEDSGEKFDPRDSSKLWMSAAKTEAGAYRPDCYQVISPYLHEDSGTEAKGQAYGKRAKQAASNLVFGREVTLQTYGKDKYGRTIADVLLPDGTNV